MRLLRRWRARNRIEVVDMDSALDLLIEGWMQAKNDPWGCGSNNQYTLGAGELIFEITVRQWADDEINALTDDDDDLECPKCNGDVA